ncbi:MAG: phosphatidate cytidylyltransferase [Pseudomonadales bacterium]|jgi:phosphatidate cytidylyltransferase
MLKSRIITALIIAPSAIAAIFLLPLEWFAVVFGVVGGLGAYEFGGLVGLQQMAARIAFVAVYALLALLTWWFKALMPLGLWLGALIWALAVLSVMTYPGNARIVEHRWLMGIAGLVISWAAWIALVVIRSAPDGSLWILWLFLLVWGADVGAYFVGKRFGRTKLAPLVSPGKTWEGIWGGLVIASIACAAVLQFMGRFNFGWLLIMLVLIAISVFGDLFESVVKRVRGVKDSGSLLPGHGGVLDRIDSVIAVLPFFALILIYSGLSDTV